MAATAIQSSAKYVETTLRLLSRQELDVPLASREILNDILTTQCAHIAYLQEEFASLVVQSKCSDDVARWYRNISKNTAVLSQEVCERIKKAAELNKATGPQQPARGSYTSGHGRGRRQFRGFRGTGSESSYNRFFRQLPPNRGGSAPRDTEDD